MSHQSDPVARGRVLVKLVGLVAMAGVITAAVVLSNRPAPTPTPTARTAPLPYQPRRPVETSGYALVIPRVQTWGPDASLAEIADCFRRVGFRHIELLDRDLARADLTAGYRLDNLIAKAILYNSEADPGRAYQTLEEARALAEGSDQTAVESLYTVIFLQGVTALRRGENENCIQCRGESSCILPIAPAAVHTNPDGSRVAARHFAEYLRQFPNDLEVRWLLNLAHMTLGDHPGGVDPAFVLSLDRWRNSEFDIGRFRDVGHLVGVNRFNQSGGAVMDDFDNDGRLDVVCTTWDATTSMVCYRNKGDGTFEDRTSPAGLAEQLGGLNLAQGDYDNDGDLDLFVPRGAWLQKGVRPSLLRNNGDGTFADVTRAAGLLEPVNSNCAAWADYDNDGHLDLFVCCEVQANRLYRNRGDGTFEEVARRAGVTAPVQMCKGCAWIDTDNDRYPDLFLNNLGGSGQLFRNNRDGTFTEVTSDLGIDGPRVGFSCWAFDYDNDGWLDLFATSYDRTMADVVKGLTGQPHNRFSTKLFRNVQGRGFKDVAKEAGLDLVFAAMGSNFGDFDNDGYLDFYLGTGEPSLGSLVPNRMFKNVGGRRFAEITSTTGTGHLQKGHGVACGDWDRDGDTDVFIEMGGFLNGDRFHNVLFQNPGQGNHWLTLKLVGQKTNRAAIGARIKVVTAEAEPLTVHRHVSSGSSFGANPLQQTLGLGKSDRVAVLEVFWPTSGTTQIFHNVAADQAIEVTEFAADYRKLDWAPIPLPK